MIEFFLVMLENMKMMLSKIKFNNVFFIVWIEQAAKSEQHK